PPSINSIVNSINQEARTLAAIINQGGTYIILSRNSTSLTDSRIDPKLANVLSSINEVRYIMPQKFLAVNITAKNVERQVILRGVMDVNGFLKTRKAYINGSSAKNVDEASIGEILSSALNLKIGDEITLSRGGKKAKLTVKCIYRTQTSADSEILVPIEAAERLTEGDGQLSAIEFTLKTDINVRDVINQISSKLPPETRILETQQLYEFIEELNQQTLTLINLLSITVYIVVAAASYIITTRLLIESSYEITMLKALGAKRNQTFALILAYTTLTSAISALLGISLGTAGTQIASTVLRWVWISIDINPFIEISQAAQTLILVLVSATLGSAYPAIKCSRTRYAEHQL
ncbi:MAG: FtsX-like permease family protein, partial [Candidatus Bathyarchaeota archaeon]|nr:FtsX-like permease family protein [Candidatus Bathyarchaeota archaeon]